MHKEVRIVAPAGYAAAAMPAPGGFRTAEELVSEAGIAAGQFQPSVPIITRGADLNVLREREQMVARMVEGLNRSEGATDVNAFLGDVREAVSYVLRNINSQTAFLPVRENLEQEVAVLIPLDTPFRNRLHRNPGSGRASVWKSIVSMGGGWSGVPQPGGSPGAVRAFFQETGAPAEHTTVWNERTATYKLLGTMGSVTGFGAAIAMNFENQLAGEKTRAIRNLMLNEEYALVNGDSTSTAAPWGDGVNALAFDGIINAISVAHGTPTAQVQGTVGALTTAFIDSMLQVMWDQGVSRPWMMMGSQEVTSLVHLAQSSGTIIRLQAAPDGETVLGIRVVGYVHPVSREIVEIISTRWLPAGTIIFGSDMTPDGKRVMDTDVLPQVQLPVLAPNQMVQGYTAQELAPTQAAPQVYPFIVSVYETYRLKQPLYVGKGTGITAV